MTYSLSDNCTKNYYNRTLTVQVIVEDVVTWIFLRHSVYSFPMVISHVHYLDSIIIRLFCRLCFIAFADKRLARFDFSSYRCVTYDYIYQPFLNFYFSHSPSSNFLATRSCLFNVYRRKIMLSSEMVDSESHNLQYKQIHTPYASKMHFQPLMMTTKFLCLKSRINKKVLCCLQCCLIKLILNKSCKVVLKTVH